MDDMTTHKASADVLAFRASEIVDTPAFRAVVESLDFKIAASSLYLNVHPENTDNTKAIVFLEAFTALVMAAMED